MPGANLDPANFEGAARLGLSRRTYADPVLRTALLPRWLVLLAILIAILIAFTQLGLWQISRANSADEQEALRTQEQLAPVPLASVTAPHAPFPADGSNLPVEVSGSYEPSLQFVVPNRVLNAEQGWWVVTGLRTDDGALLPVLRGWVSDPLQAGTPDAGRRVVQGTLAPSESAVPDADGTPLASGELASIELATLANTWSGDLYNAFIFATDEQPPVAGDVVPVPPPSLGGESLDWRNLGYALQWWVFAGFAVYMYWRFLRDATYPPVTEDAEPRSRDMKKEGAP